MHGNSEPIGEALANEASHPVLLEKVSFRYGKSSADTLKGVDLALDQGIHALIGRNGSGKTSLMRLIVGLLQPTAGELRTMGVRLPATNHIRRQLMSQIGYLPQTFSYPSNFTVQEFVEYSGWLKGLSSTESRQKAIEAIDEVQLAQHTEKHLRKLSGGMLRRAGIASSLVHDPSLLILDEPTSGLDPEQRINFRELLSKVARNRCVILSSHLIEDVKALANSIVILDEGEVRFHGSQDDLICRTSVDARGESELERAYTSVLSEPQP